ncbi:sorting nexin-17 isoform X3 [Leptopilina heterotoma]|uniref:sorting nexin-17 isoform X3 n=1 Tax=Leptopilina heterotoma TaxID=63436 RepID=UPI001CA8AD9E|nr:sorting nexin-17 isoform X3 [Leptopilina heterotoma]
MHFSIPNTQELLDQSGNSFLGYNIHINGLFHCTVRYKQFHNLHEKIIKDFDAILLSFPPKKFFPLTVNQQEDRRRALEKYMQTLGQNTSIVKSRLLNAFLLNAQIETNGSTIKSENFNVYLYNWQKITLEVANTDNSKQILKKLCRHIKLPERYDSYFSLFITLQDEDASVNIIRKLQDFESPVITHKALQRNDMKVIFGKWFWDINYDLELMHDPVGLNLLYIQVVAEVERGWIIIPKQRRHQLFLLCQHTAKKEDEDKCKENFGSSLELSFEYLISKNHLQWIRISSEQSILMSLCLQSMIEELILKNADDCEPQNTETGSFAKQPIMKNVSEEIGLKKNKITRKDSKILSNLHRIDCNKMENNAFNLIGDDDL